MRVVHGLNIDKLLKNPDQGMGHDLDVFEES